MYEISEQNTPAPKLGYFNLIFNKIKNYVSTNKYEIILLIVYAIVVIATVASGWWLVLAHSAGVMGRKPFLILILPIIISVALLLVLLQKWHGCPQKVFALLAIPALMFFAFFMPPNQIPDEFGHINRAFDFLLTNGGATIPDCFAKFDESYPTDYSMLYNAIMSRPKWGATILSTDGYVRYPTHLYVIAGIGAKIAELLNMNPFVAVCVARSANAFVFLLAGYWIIKSLPLGKVLACVYLLNPMLIQQEASCSADAMTNILVLVYLAYFVKLVFLRDIAKHQYVLLAIWTVLMAISKYAYAPFVLLWLLFVKRIDNKKIRIAIYSIVYSVLFVAVLLVVLFYDGSTYKPTFELIRDVPELLFVMFNTIKGMTALWVKETFGMILGALNVHIWEPWFWIYTLMLIFSIVFNLGEKKEFSRNQKIFIIILSIVTSIAMILVFREWTLNVDQRSDLIMGVQGRYFLPYLLLPLMCFITKRSSLARPKVMILYSVILLIIYISTGITIIEYFGLPE